MLSRALIGAGALAFASALASHAFATGFCPCLTDLNNDGVTDGADLGITLGAWGQGRGSVADFDESGLVDGADLGILLGAWGPCAPPANDECNTPEVIDGYDLSIEFCTAAATTSANSGFPNCDGTAVPMVKDIWYRWVAPYDGKLALTTCGQVDFDTVIAVYSSIFDGVCACPGGIFTSFLGCNDDTCGSDAALEIDMDAGRCYSIRLGGYGFTNPEEGQGTMHLRAIKVGDRCDIAHDLPSVNFQIVDGTNAGDTWIQADPTSCAQDDTIDEWYRFVMPCQGSVTISTCNAGTDYDTTLAVFSGCGSGQQIACNDDSTDPGCQLDGNNLKSTVTVNAAGGEVLYIRVSGFLGEVGTFEMTIDVDCLQ
ncbi:MAG: hypothetical protein JNM94_10595 [Phycisphaerae bacterium]|nr:hypothetical protein [Phycisphaerae bacterium]